MINYSNKISRSPELNYSWKTPVMFFALAMLMLIGAPANAYSQDTLQKIIPARVNDPAQMNKPYLILISVDGFRYDYAKKYGASNLLRYAAGGVAAEGIRPGFPSLTFPNHYSIVTGLYPAHHGIVDNYFYDRQKKKIYNKGIQSIVQDSSWYGGTPIWALAEKQKMLSATLFWVGAEAPVKGFRPTYNYNFTKQISVDDRIMIVRKWLDLPGESRPHIICLYFYEVDNAGHEFGPDAAETGMAVRKMDTVIDKLVRTVAETGLPVNFIVLSDHGMEAVDYKNPISLPQEIDKQKFIVPPGDALLQLYALEKSSIMPTYKALRNNANGFRVYLQNGLPRKWQFTTRDDRFGRIGDILLIPQEGKVFNITNTEVDKGKHGFDPAHQKMMAGFYAWGPAFKNGLTIKAFDNVHVFPLMVKLLRLDFDEKIDGKTAILRPILK
jgi:predicted AlkP superfamily pyrophosphatase or phosphodiesterase